MEEEYLFRDSQDLQFLQNHVQLAYQTYKDLLNPTVTWESSKTKDSTINPNYTPRNSIFLKDPSAQKVYREEILEKIHEVPSSDPLYLYSDLLLKEFLELKLKNSPVLVASSLAKFYFSRVHSLQDFKYKFLLNWANTIQYSSNGSIVKDKIRVLDTEVIDCIEAYERLRKPEDVPIVPTKQDMPKSDVVLIKSNDVEYYVNTKARELELGRSLNTLHYKVKWSWVGNRTEIWKKSMKFLAELKKQSVDRMKLLTGLDDIGEQKLVVSLVTNVNLKNLKKQQEIQRRAKADHSTFAEEHKNLNEQLLNSSNDQIDAPPQILTETSQLNGLLDHICKEFKLVGDVVTDDGHALSYQITHLLPDIFEVQRKRQEWKPYETPEKDITLIRLGNIQNLKRASTIKKTIADIAPHQVTGYKIVKVLSLKEVDWSLEKILPQIQPWQKRQKIRLEKFGKYDSLLKASFELLDVQDISTINRVIEEFSMNYCERASKRGVLKTDLGLSDEDIKKRYFSALLSENVQANNPPSEDSIELSMVTIKGLYTLKYLKSRGLKLKLFELFNFYRSTQRRLTLDLEFLENGFKETFHPSASSKVPLLQSLDGEIAQYYPDNLPSLYGRQDIIESMEGNIYISDETGEYIIYKPVESDIKSILHELQLLGSYYIDKYEVWSEDQGENYPAIDRDFLTNELLEEEVKFQESKARLVTDYMEIYKFAVSEADQRKIAQLIIDLIALRPRLYLQGSYFTQSYWAHRQAIERQSEFLKSIINHYNLTDGIDLVPEYSKVYSIWELVENVIKEISVVHETETPIAHSTLERAVWENTYEIWRTIGSYRSPFNDKIIIDNTAQAMHLLRTLKEDIRDKNLLPKLTPSMFETKSKAPIASDLPDDTQILCNYFEAFNLRSCLETHYEETQSIESIYRKQALSMKRESIEVEFVSFFSGHPHMSNLRDWPGSKSSFKLPAFEISPILTENMDLKSPSGFKLMLLPLGLEELKAVTEYQVMHKHLLIISCILNQYAIDKWERQIAEIELARTDSYIPKKTKVHWPSVLGRKGEGLVEEKAENEVKSIKAKIFSQIAEYCIDIRKVKLDHREKMKENFHRILKKYVAVLTEKSEYYENVCRFLMAQVVNGYCREVLRDIYVHGIKIHLIKITQDLKKVFSLIPSVFKDEITENFPIDKDGSFLSLLCVPSIDSILSLPGINNQDIWKVWDPYFYAETPEVIIKKIKTLAFKPRLSEGEQTNISFLHEWCFTSKLRTMLETLRASSQIVHLALFELLLDVKNLDLMNLYEQIQEGRNYWAKKENEDLSEMHLRAVQGLLEESSPVQTFHKKAQIFIKRMNEMKSDILKLPQNSVVPYLIQKAKVQYLKFSAVLFETTEYGLFNFDENEAKELISLITDTFRYNRKSIFVPNKDYGKVSECDLIELCEKKIFINNFPVLTISSSGLSTLDSVLICSKWELRKYAYEKFEFFSKNLENSISNKGLTDVNDQLTHSITYLQNALMTHRLRSAYLMVIRHKDLILDPILFQNSLLFYQNTIGLKSQISSKRMREDNYISKSISETKLLKDIFQSFICKFSINYIIQECSLLFDTSKLNNIVVIHNEFSCNADRSYNDITKRIGCLHHYLNNLRNRCTLVEAPTCGKAHVFLVKDMTKLTKKFADRIVKYMETEFRVKEESFLVQFEQLEKVKLQKDEEIKELARVLKNLQGNLENLVNSKLSQKGNSLIYELDRSHRKLSEIKANMKLMPKQIREIVYLDYKEEIEKNKRKISDLRQNFFNFKSELTQELKADISFHKTNAFSEIKNKTSKSKARDINVLITEDLNFTKKKQQVDMESLQNLNRKIWFLKVWAKTYRKNKFQRNIKMLQDDLTSNQFLWEQLNESQRREALLKQELSYTQQSLAAAEKLADRLQTSIEDMNNQRLRLQQYKSNKGKRLNELEVRVKQQEKIEHRDNQILLTQFYTQNEKVQSLQISEEKAGQEYIPHHIRYQKEISNLKKTLKREQNMKLNAFDELNRFRNEIKNINKEPEARIKEMRTEYQKLTSELKNIKDQNTLFKKRIIDTGDHEFLSAYQGKPDPYELLKTVSSRMASRANFEDN